jgi:hypothetical protein
MSKAGWVKAPSSASSCRWNGSRPLRSARRSRTPSALTPCDQREFTWASLASPAPVAAPNTRRSPIQAATRPRRRCDLAQRCSRHHRPLQPLALAWVCLSGFESASATPSGLQSPTLWELRCLSRTEPGFVLPSASRLRCAWRLRLERAGRTSRTRKRRWNTASRPYPVGQSRAGRGCSPAGRRKLSHHQHRWPDCQGGARWFE